MSESERPPIRAFDSSLPMALLSAREAAMNHFRPLLAEHDLTEQQWRVLRALNAAPDAVDVRALINATSLLAPSLTRILANFEERELIDRSLDPSDQRRSIIALSKSGRAVVRTVAPSSEAIYAMIETKFGTERLGALMTELRDLAAAIKETDQ